jgi:Family of unknown function (DUF6339)
MKLRLLRERALGELRASVKDNLARYKSGNFDHLLIDPALSFESEIDFIEDEIGQLKKPKVDETFEAENCAVMLAALPEMTPYQAADERAWVMLSHTFLLQHARARWPIPNGKDDAVQHILTHFFARNYRQLERDNVGSRLWWMGHLCSRVNSMPLKQTLEVLLHRSDVRANIVERPTTSQSIPVFTAVLSRLAESHKGKQKLFERATFRRLMVRINGLGGYKLLDALDSKSVEQLIDQVISKDLGLSSV